MIGIFGTHFDPMALERTASGKASETLVQALDGIDQEFQEARLTSVYLFGKLRGDDIAVGAAKHEEKGLIPFICKTIDDHFERLGHLPESSEKRRIYQQLERLRELEESSISARNFVEHALASSNEHMMRQRDRNQMEQERQQESRDLKELRLKLYSAQDRTQLQDIQKDQREKEDGRRHERERKTVMADAKDQLPDSEWYFTSCFDEDTAASIRSRALQRFQAIQFQKIPSAAATKSVAEVEAFVQQSLQFVERHFCLAVEESLKLFETCQHRAQSHYNETSEKFDGLSQGETASRRKTRCNLWGLEARAKKMGRAVDFMKSFKVDPELLAELPASSSSPSDAPQLGMNAANAPDGWDGFAKDLACGLNPNRFGL